MKLKKWFIAGALLTGGSTTVQAQYNINGSIVNYESIDNDNNYHRYIYMTGAEIVFRTKPNPSVPTLEVARMKKDSLMMFVPVNISGHLRASHIFSSNNITADKSISGAYFQADSMRVKKIVGELQADSINSAKINTSNISSAGLFISGNVGMGMQADNSIISTSTPDPDIDRLAVRGSLVTYLGATDVAAATSYRMLKLHNAKSATTDSWHIGFSANSNTNGSGYQELVQLRTKKTASGPVFSVASDNAGVMTDRLKVQQNGNIAIGLDTAVEKLAVNGKVKATGFVTDASSFPDYVFTPGYQLRSIDALAGYVREHRKLPGMPSEQEVVGKGLNLADVSISTVEKVEELSLYIIQLNDRIKQLEARLAIAGK